MQKRSGLSISTHALTEGDDMGALEQKLLEISTHALTEGDRVLDRAVKKGKEFQLTPSRRATLQLLSLMQAEIFQLTPSRRATIVP